ncbi:MAG: ferritin [Thermoguttaceae bacterium]
MSITRKMEEAINAQINAEFYSAYLYLAMSFQADYLKFPGVANWLNVQYQEELAHAMGFMTYLQNRGGCVRLTAIAAPPEKWDDVLSMFQMTCEHEAAVTAMINNLAAIAFEERDFSASQFLNWYIREQVEEEATADKILTELKRAMQSPEAMLMLDRELATRTFVAPIIA